MEKRPVPPFPFRHHIRVRGWRLGIYIEKMGVNTPALAVRQDFPAQRVDPHHPGGGQRKRGPQPHQIHQHIVRRPAGSLRLTPDIGQMTALRINIHHFDLIDNPIAPGEEAGTGLGNFCRVFCLHNLPKLL